jgi:hypothetical protein
VRLILLALLAKLIGLLRKLHTLRRIGLI